MASDPLAFAQPLLARWFRASIGEPTAAQAKAWPAIARGESTLLLAPTGSGKTLAAFLVALNRLLFRNDTEAGTRVLYVSPLKALGVDVERNLTTPLAALRRDAEAAGLAVSPLRIGVRSGDTPAKERVRLAKQPPEILITTPESLYLMLSSRARASLADVQTVVIDEVHALSGNKRGAHLMLSLERLEALRAAGAPALQRVGLSATQRPLEVIAEWLGGGTWHGEQHLPRPVTIVDAGLVKKHVLEVEAPGGDSAGEARWLQTQQRVLQLVLDHRSTLIFVNNRRLAERTAAALNQLAGEEVALAHHGSVAKDARAVIEGRLKAGELRAVVATASLELGIDMGSVECVVQLDAPPSVASLLQRVGRAGHQVGATSRGVLISKFRGDLLACSSLVSQALAGQVERTAPPSNPLDVLAQHVVSMLVEAPLHVDAVFDVVRRAAPFRELRRESFEAVLDMLSGRYASPRFVELRPRINYDRVNGTLEARRGARLLVSANPGTIVDRGLYGVFLAGAQQPMRVGELDEEMVYESRVGDVFSLGASAWRIEEIGFDRVLVSPAPGQPGRMPFWRGTKLGRSLPLGRAMGELARQLGALSREEAEAKLRTEHGANAEAATQLVGYLHEQSAQGQVPTDRTVVLELFRDEVGDYRAILLSPLGGRVHAPWCTLVRARLERELGLEVDALWADDGMVFRLPAAATAPEPAWFFPSPGDCGEPLTAALSNSPVFAAHFRENAARALLLPRRRPGGRVPLWVQRRRAKDLLTVAGDYADFPIVLETVRECLRDVFDVAGLRSLLTDIVEGRVEACVLEQGRPSPFAAALWATFLGNFVYSEDAPLERRARALHLDQAQLQLLLGEPELRELLDPRLIAQLERELQNLDQRQPLRDADDLFDLLLRLGDSSLGELEVRSGGGQLAAWLQQLGARGQALPITVAGEERWIAAQDATRYHAVCGSEVPDTVPAALRAPAARPLEDLLLRYARTHTPFVAADAARRFGLPSDLCRTELLRLVAERRLEHGAFLPAGKEPEYCDPDVLRRLKAQSLAQLRRQIEPVSTAAYCRFLLEWQHVLRPLRGSDGVLIALEQLQGLVLPYSSWVNDVLPARVENFAAYELDELCARGEIIWRGFPGQSEPKLAFYFPENYANLAPEVSAPETPLAVRIREYLQSRGAAFFPDLVASLDAFAGDVFAELWALVRAGVVHNDTLLPVRSLIADKQQRDKASGRERPSRSSSLASGRGLGGLRRSASAGQRAGSEGRWALLSAVGQEPTARVLAQGELLLTRYGVLTREGVNGAAIEGGFGQIYPLLRSLEEAGKILRGYFIAAEGPDAVGANQFAWPGAEVRLRSAREATLGRELVWLSAADPANAYGLIVPWPEHVETRPARVVGSAVILDEGRLLAWIAKDRARICLYPTADWSERDTPNRLARRLVGQFERGSERAWLIERIDQWPAQELLSAHSSSSALDDESTPPSAAAARAFAQALQSLGFRSGHAGLQKLRESGR